MTHRYCTTCGDSRNTCRHTTPGADLDNLRRIVRIGLYRRDGTRIMDGIGAPVAHVIDIEYSDTLVSAANALPALLADHARLTVEVDRLREGLEEQHMAEADRIAGAGGCCGGCDAAWLTAEVARLNERQQELLQTIRNLSASVPYPEEQRAASVLIAEVGTLRSALTAKEAEVARLRGLVERAVQTMEYRGINYVAAELRKEAAGE